MRKTENEIIKVKASKIDMGITPESISRSGGR
jgi:hypothetical protein